MFHPSPRRTLRAAARPGGDSTRLLRALCGLSVVISVIAAYPTTLFALTPPSARITDLAPGLTITVLCSAACDSTSCGGNCSSGDPNDPLEPMGLGSQGAAQVDAAGWWYMPWQSDPLTCGIWEPTRQSLRRWRADGTSEILFRIEGECIVVGSSIIDVSIYGLYLDPFAGSVILPIDVSERSCTPGFGCSPVATSYELIEISGLPRLSDTISTPTPCPDADADAFRDCVTTQGCSPYGGACGDCDDSNPTINPRGSEAKPPANRGDGKDNDCNGTVDDRSRLIPHAETP